MWLVAFLFLNLNSSLCKFVFRLSTFMQHAHSFIIFKWLTWFHRCYYYFLPFFPWLLTQHTAHSHASICSAPFLACSRTVMCGQFFFVFWITVFAFHVSLAWCTFQTVFGFCLFPAACGLDTSAVTYLVPSWCHQIPRALISPPSHLSSNSWRFQSKGRKRDW